jgi:glycosyltransferase involved in cell wall biosynthesis
LLYVGRLHVEKGVDTLLDAWPRVLCQVPDGTLVLVGDGPLREDLQARGIPRVLFVGNVQDPLPYLQAAEVFVLPSRSEGLSGALLEAMATGLPCVATAIGGTVDVVTDGVDGWLVPANHPDALAQRLTTALLDPPERARVGLAARQRVLREFSLTDVARRLAQVYRALVAEA